ncbi:MAG: DNA helicase RecG [Candidatus Moranbacteria bacterium CG10_big_fil_rev_8_21_14_0_10_35_21]|nr:MAG: DNA helicase RecG [Candidatus Moranbacteria bacterium CG10_big_fil_rev_8_21_14_0_10_35_21]PJA88576.1 MAG: DNA helicase RecG [Candidatus Moranbacteria bacterium CG_4_9_14_3_um_filter_36_9]
MITLKTPIQKLPRIGEKYLSKISHLNIHTIGDLFFHFPARYVDYSNLMPISQIKTDELITIQGKITKNKTTRTWRRKMYLTEILVSDATGSVKALWFNQPYLTEALEEGREIRLSGKLSKGKSGIYFSNPSWELASRIPTNTGRLVPIYPETAGVTSRWLRWQIQCLFKLNIEFFDPIPQEILQKLHLPDLKRALFWIHFPKKEDQYLLAQKRFAFQEMFFLQIKSLLVRHQWNQEKAVAIKFNEKQINPFLKSLPFQLTNSQKKAYLEILKDLIKEQPMNRLLNGDVGSGKTIVAAIALLATALAKYQSTLMAPTEVLALQHFKNITTLFALHKITIGLLTNSYQIIKKGNAAEKKITRSEILEKIKKGQVDIIIGTHSLIQKDIRFKNLALVIIDEQHRFGVSQRAFLQQEASKISDGIKNKIPHFLTMSATPIPRTLALAFFGNLDLSILDEMPKDRKKIITQIISPTDRQKTYNFIQKEVADSRQVFIILPLVEESKILTETKAAVQEHRRLSEEVFPDLKIGLVHGRLKSEEKERVMQNFQENKINILVATSVVEVGVDIPNASIMLIEDADRFGLSQLHQFRGRVGRSSYQSYCFLFSEKNSGLAQRRLKALEKSQNGFEIAEKDLKLRGPGEFFGTRQSGLPDIGMENLTNIKLIKISRNEAENLITDDPFLEKHSSLKKEVDTFYQKIHLE